MKRSHYENSNDNNKDRDRDKDRDNYYHHKNNSSNYSYDNRSFQRSYSNNHDVYRNKYGEIKQNNDCYRHVPLNYNTAYSSVHYEKHYVQHGPNYNGYPNPTFSQSSHLPQRHREEYQRNQQSNYYNKPVISNYPPRNVKVNDDREYGRKNYVYRDDIHKNNYSLSASNEKKEINKEKYKKKNDALLEEINYAFNNPNVIKLELIELILQSSDLYINHLIRLVENFRRPAKKFITENRDKEEKEKFTAVITTLFNKCNDIFECSHKKSKEKQLFSENGFLNVESQMMALAFLISNLGNLSPLSGNKISSTNINYFLQQIASLIKKYRGLKKFNRIKIGRAIDLVFSGVSDFNKSGLYVMNEDYNLEHINTLLNELTLLPQNTSGLLNYITTTILATANIFSNNQANGDKFDPEDLEKTKTKNVKLNYETIEKLFSIASYLVKETREISTFLKQAGNLVSGNQFPYLHEEIIDRFLSKLNALYNVNGGGSNDLESLAYSFYGAGRAAKRLNSTNKNKFPVNINIINELLNKLSILLKDAPYVDPENIGRIIRGLESLEKKGKLNGQLNSNAIISLLKNFNHANVLDTKAYKTTIEGINFLIESKQIDSSLIDVTIRNKFNEGYKELAFLPIDYSTRSSQNYHAETVLEKEVNIVLLESFIPNNEVPDIEQSKEVLSPPTIDQSKQQEVSSHDELKLPKLKIKLKVPQSQIVLPESPTFPQQHQKITRKEDAIISDGNVNPIPQKAPLLPIQAVESTINTDDSKTKTKKIKSSVKKKKTSQSKKIKQKKKKTTKKQSIVSKNINLLSNNDVPVFNSAEEKIQYEIDLFVSIYTEYYFGISKKAKKRYVMVYKSLADFLAFLYSPTGKISFISLESYNAYLKKLEFNGRPLNLRIKSNRKKNPRCQLLWNKEQVVVVNVVDVKKKEAAIIQHKNHWPKMEGNQTKTQQVQPMAKKQPRYPIAVKQPRKISTETNTPLSNENFIKPFPIKIGTLSQVGLFANSKRKQDTIEHFSKIAKDNILVENNLNHDEEGQDSVESNLDLENCHMSDTEALREEVELNPATTSLQSEEELANFDLGLFGGFYEQELDGDEFLSSIYSPKK